MAKEIPFEEMDSTGMFSHLMDNNAEKMQWNKNSAVELLAMADELEEQAEKYRHLAATLILDAQGYADATASLLRMEFPMTDIEEISDEPDE
jgi:uncharacterized coiled-coil DUF342 family protein